MRKIYLVSTLSRGMSTLVPTLLRGMLIMLLMTSVVYGAPRAVLIELQSATW